MIKLTKIIWFWLLVVAISSLVSGCKGSSSDSGGSSSSGNETAPIVVTVTDISGVRMPNTTVVLGDSNGAMRTYGVTDADGQITFDNAPANATITTATTCLRSGSTTTTYSINVQYDVNSSAVLSLDNCSSMPFSIISVPSNTPLGTVTVNITSMPSEVIQNQITIGHHGYMSFGGVMTRQTATITESDLDNDGTYSIFVTGRDAHYNSIAYGVLLDQTFTNGMTVDVQMEPMSFVQYQISNLPAATINLHSFLVIARTGKQSFGSSQSFSLLSAPSSTTVALPYIPGYGNSVSYYISADLDQDRDGVADSYQSLSLGSSACPPSNQTFDLGEALSAPSATVIDSDTATPTFLWSGVDPTATSIYFAANMHSSTAYLYLGFSNLVRSRTSIRYPELPDSLAPFRPNQVDYFSVYTYANEGSLFKSSSGSYQAPNSPIMTTRP